MQETGFIGEIASLIEKIVDVAAGGPQKRERQAGKMAAAAQADLEAAKLAQQTAALQAAQSQVAGPQPSLLFGLPSWAPLAVGGVLLYLVLRKR